MPLLDQNDFDRLKARPTHCCRHCQGQIRMNYCRQCDDFYQQGHRPNCTFGSESEHAAHRTYDLTKDRESEARINNESR